MERVFVIVCALLVSASAGPISLDSNSCSRACTDRGKFNYAIGKTYIYQYESDIRTALQGASEDHATLHLTASVQLEILSKCEMSMRLTDVTLTEYDPVDSIMKEVSSEFKSGLERFPVRMSFQDGGIDDICLSGPEPIWVMNAKRGIISLIQNNMQDFETNRTVAETDVSGVCDTEYFVHQTEWYKTTIKKSKNLLGCTERQGYNSAIQGVPYTSQSDIQSLPILKSDHNCVHEIDRQGGYLKSARCQEQHMFRPFSKSDSGAVTINTQTLTYVRMTSGTKSPEPVTTRVALTFEHVHDVEAGGRNRKDITRKLMEICEKTKSGVRPETPRLFTDLVYLMKSVDAETLSAIYKMLAEETICPDNHFRTRKYFLDALPMTGTSASVHMITELITSNTITGLEADMWLTTLSFIKNPTKDMLKEVKPLINSPHNSEKALLSVGTMVHSYCYYNGNCEDDDLVKAIISAFTNKMSKGCKVKDDNMKTTLLALRGIGNAGYATSAIPMLSTCMRLNSNPTEIRLSAIEAFRRMPCGSERGALMGLLQNTKEDSEIRIAAYKVLMECPTEKIIGLVRNTLASEEVNQVGSYIWTHLTNLMETSDRHKQDIRAVLEDETFKKEFDMDKRKFSRNYEGSMFNERLNTGAKFEGDLIWSMKSFIPRSAMMNFTFDLFGHSVNLFEFGGRAEGLEYFFESFFGPSGYFKNPNEGGSTSELLPNDIKSEKIKKIDKRFSAQMADLRGSLYMRVFGNELRYMNFKGIDSLFSGGSDFNILDLLIKLSEDNDYTYTHSAMFLDSSYIVPTSSGFPLNLTVNGTATVDLRMKGKMDLRHPPTLDIAGLVRPSAAIDVSSLMSVDAFFTKSGIKMVSTLHTSTALQGKLSIDKKGAIITEYEMPEPRMEIIDVKSSFFTVHRDMEREQKMTEDNRQSLAYCSPEKIVTITGLELCAEVSYPNTSKKSDAPYFPITGPVSAGIYLYNRDTHVKYRMEAKSMHDKDRNLVHFTFDTPESRIDRHIEVDFNLDKRELALDATFISPWKKADFQGTITNTKKSSAISGKMNIDGKAPYSFDAQLAKDVSGNTYIFQPSLEIQANKETHFTLKGMFSLKNWKQVDIQFDADGITKEPVSGKLTLHNKETLRGIQGSLDISKNKQYSFDINLATTAYKKKILYKPLVSIRTPSTELIAFGGGVTYIFGKGLDINLVLDKVAAKKITLTGKLNKAEKRRRSVFNTKLDFRSSPADFSIKARFDKRSKGSIASDIDITYVIRRIARNNIKLVSKIINQSSKSLTKARVNMNLEVKRNPELNLKLLSEISHNKRHTEISGDLWYGPDFKNDEKHAEIRFEMNKNLIGLTDVSADIQTRVRVPELDIALMMKAAHSHNVKNLNSNVTFKYGKGQPVETSLQIHDRSEEEVELLKVETQYQLSFPGCNFNIDHVLEEKVDNSYVSTLKTQKRKGEENVIITTIRLNQKKVAIDSDVNMFGQNPFKLRGEIGLDPFDFITSLSLETGTTKYAGSLTSVTENGKSSWLLLDIYNPSRHMIISLSVKNTDGVLFGDVKIQLNNTHTIMLNAWLEEPRPERLNGSVTISYPSRTVILNAHFTKGSKYSSHVDCQWSKTQKITADTVLDITSDAVLGNVQLSTPFTSFPKLNIVTKLSHDSEQYNFDGSVSWEDSNLVSLKTEIKKPISLKTFVSSASIKSSKTSLLGLKTITLDVNHKLSNSLATSLRLGWNRQFVQTDVILQNTTKGRNMGFSGTANMKTSFQFIKKGKLIINHDNNGRIFNTDITVNRNRKAYKILSKINHQPIEGRYDNTGSLKIMLPTGSVETTWDHSHTPVNIATSMTSIWGKKKEKKIIGIFNSYFNDNFGASFELQTPFAVVHDTKFVTSYTRQTDMMNYNINLNVDGDVLGSADIEYSNDDKIASSLTVVIPDLHVDTRFEAEANFPKASTLSGYMKAVISPEISMSVEAKSEVSKSGSLSHTSIIWKTSFPGYEEVRYTYDVEVDDYISTVTKLDYSSRKQIKVETKFRYDHMDKHASVVITTPFVSMTKFQGGVNMQGNLDSLQSDISLEIQPYFDKTSASFIWDTKSGLNSKIRIDLPIAEYPYFQADASGQFGITASELSIKIEYMPKEIVQLELMHKQNDADLKISAKAISPTGKVSLQHAGNWHDFKSKVEIEDLKMRNYGLDISFTNAAMTEGMVTISTPGRRDVSFLFSHSGNVLNFNTHAKIMHNRKNNFMSDIIFTTENKIKMSVSGSLRSQIISETEEYEAAFDFEGIPTKFNAHGEFSTTSLGKSEADIYLDLTNSSEGNLNIKSPLMENIKASFNHLKHEDNYMQSALDFVYSGYKIVDIYGSLNRKDSVICELKFITPVFKDLYLKARFDGDMKSFDAKSDVSYGGRKAKIDILSKIESRKIQQKISIEGTSLKDISAEYSINGDLTRMKSFGEYNIGGDRHRIDLLYTNAENKEGYFSLETPLTHPVTINLRHIGPLNDFTSHADIKLASGISAVDVAFQINEKKDVSMTTEIKSPFIKDVMLSLSHENRKPELLTNGRLSIDGMDDFNIQFKSSKRPLSVSIAIKTPIENFTNFETSVSLKELSSEGKSFNFNYNLNGKKSNIDVIYSKAEKRSVQVTTTSHLIPDTSVLIEHEGKLNDFTSHAEYSFGNLKSELDVFFKSMPKYEGLFAINSHLIPYFSISFEHKGSLREFESNSALRVAYSKRELDITMDIKNDINIQIQYQCPIHGLSTVIVTHEGGPADFKCHGEVSTGAEKWEGDFTFSSRSQVQGKLTLKPAFSSKFEPLTFQFEHSGELSNFRTHSEFILGNEKTTNDIAVIVSDTAASTSIKMKSPYYREIASNLRYEGELKNLKLHADLLFGSDQLDSDFQLQITDSSVASSFNFTSTMSEDISADLKIIGEPTSISSNANIRIGRNLNGASFYCSKVDDEVTSSLHIKSTYMKDVSVDFLLRGDIAQFHTEYDINIDGKRNKGLIELNLNDGLYGKISVDENRFSAKGTAEEGIISVEYLGEHTAELRYSLKNKIVFDSNIITPYKGYSIISATYEHSGNLRNFRCSGKVSIEEQESTFNMALDTRDLLNMNGRFMLSSPYIPPFDIEISNSISQRKHNYNAEINIDSRKMFGIFFAVINDTERDVQQINIELHLSGVRHKLLEMMSTSSEFKMSSDIFYKGDNNKLEMIISTKPSNSDKQLAGSLMLNIPSYLSDQLNGELLILLSTNSLSFDTKMTSGSRKLFDLTLNCDMQDKYYIKFALESVEPHSLSAKFLVSYDKQTFEMNWELIHDSVKLTDGNMDFTVKKEPAFLVGTAVLNTQRILTSFNIHFDPDNLICRLDAVLTIGKDTWSTLVNFDANDKVDASFEVGIPRMEKIKGTLTHSQRTYKSKSSVELQFNSTHKFEIDMEMKWRNGYGCSVTLKTPFEGYATSALKAEYESSIPNVKSSLEINVANKIFSASATVSKSDVFKADFSLVTPYELIENIDLSLYHHGSQSNFRTGGKLMYATGKDIEADIEHKWIGMTQESKARFMSPYTDEIIFSANNRGSRSDFSSSFDIAIGSDIQLVSNTLLTAKSQYLRFSNIVSANISKETYEQKLELTHDGSLEKFRTEVLFQYLSDIYRMDTSFQLDPVLEGAIEIKTPFKKFSDTKASFRHTGTSSEFSTTVEVQYAPMTMNSEKLELSGTLAASMNPLSIDLDIRTPFKRFETISLNGKYRIKNNQIRSQIQGQWDTENRFDVDATLSTTSPFTGEISILTPFEHLRDASITISKKQSTNGYPGNFKIIHNSKTLIDVEFDQQLPLQQKHIHITIQSPAPRPMKFEFEGDFTLKFVELGFTANWNTNDLNSNLRLEAGYDIRSEKSVKFRLMQSKIPGKILSFTATLKGMSSRADLAWGNQPADKVSYEINIGDYNGNFKLVLPSRTLLFAGSHRGTVSEGSFMWDADVDETKKVGFQSRMVTARGVVKADITIIMPSLGKNVKVGSEILVNRGQVIFDGKTTLSYSGDSRKTLVLTSKLEDISTSGSKNYSFSFGVSHPYTTLGMTVNTHAGKSNTGYSAGVGLEYLTVKRQTKKFLIGGQIDKLRKSVSLELQSPIKSISISGSVQTDDKFRVSLLNVYDQKQPLHTQFTFDSAARSIDFVTNFDLDNPRDEFHINSKYVNRSAIAAEVFHVVSGIRMTDVLITTRLNNSNLLHSRLHWRPDMIQDFEALMERKRIKYNKRMHSEAARIEKEIVEEVTEKFRYIWGAVAEEIGHENLARFEAAVVPWLDLGLQTTIAVSQPVLQHLNKILSRSSGSTYKDLRRNNPIPQHGAELEASSLDTEYLAFLAQTISDNFDLVSDKLKLPAEHIPGYITAIATGTAEKITGSAKINTLQVLLEAVEAYVRDELVIAEQKLEEKLRRLEKIVMGHFKSPFTVYDPAHGEIQMELYSIIPLQSLDRLPVINFVENIEKIKRLKTYVSNNIPDLSMPNLSGEWVPPFTGVASVTMGHKITTFDGFVYDLSADCTYMLTRDYVNGNFSLILSNDGYTTLTVLTSGNPISVNIQGEILVDGKPATLPFTEGYVTVSQGDGGIVTINGGNHFTINYDLTLDHITIQISGWYYGKTGGLLGVYDNEPSNDLMTPFNKVIDNSSRFARTWDVGTNSCR